MSSGSSSSSPVKLRRSRTTSVSKLGQQPVLSDQTGCRVYTAGRPPWFSTDGEITKPFVIGICGGSASGKTTVARAIIENLHQPWVSLLCMDSYYREYTPEEKPAIMANNFNFDHPDAFDLDLVVETLGRLKKGKSVKVPVYDFTTHSRIKGGEVEIYGANVIIFEGILAFCDDWLLELIDLKVFVDTDSDERLARRLLRDINERGRELAGVLLQYERFVKPSFEEFIAPTKSKSDIIVPRGGGNKVAVDLICKHVLKQLQHRGLNTRSKLAETYGDPMLTGEPSYPSNLLILPETNQVKHLHTIIRNRDTPRDEFVFYSNRLMRLLFEYALSTMPADTWEEVSIPINNPKDSSDDTHFYRGVKRRHNNLIGVSVLRAGETLEPSLASVAKDVQLGKILIQTNPKTREPELHYLRLPPNLTGAQVILMDATIATGAAAMMAIRVLVEHDVLQENITLCCLLAAAPGVCAVAYAFPRVRIVTTAVDSHLSKEYFIVPGMGNFGDRYFGTERLPDAEELQKDELDAFKLRC